MSTSWRKYVGQCKSRLSAISRCCYLGRNRWREKYRQLKAHSEFFRDEAAEFRIRCEELEQIKRQLEEWVAELQSERDQQRQITLPVGQIPPGLQYGAGLIALCVNCASAIGLQPTVRVLTILFEWLQVEHAVPTYQTIRGWMQRLGLDRMQNARKKEGGVVLADHTNQIGREKVLALMRAPEFPMDRSHVPLRHCDVELLAVIPGEKWKREDVQKEYQKLCEQYGSPRAFASDGAVELREPVEFLGKPGERPLTLRDPKHFLANQIEALLTKEPQYQDFVKQLAGTRSALQQTELAHFIPPAAKMKSRFMNLAPTLKWASAVLWHLNHPKSRSRKNVTESRMEQKLGWLREYALDIRTWQQCQNVVSTALTFINKQGIFRGAKDQFKDLVAGCATKPMSKQLVSKTVQFFSDHEEQLLPHERLPMSTEILESAFARYKQLEKQHSKNGFTSLLLTLPTLLRSTTPEEITASFSRVKTEDVKAWVKENLSTTLTAKRQLMFREAGPRKKKKVKKCATPTGAAA